MVYGYGVWRGETDAEKMERGIYANRSATPDAEGRTLEFVLLIFSILPIKHYSPVNMYSFEHFQECKI